MGEQLTTRSGKAGRITVLVIAVLLVAGAVALAIWSPTADEFRNTRFVNAALGSGIGEPLIEVPGGDAANGPSAMQRYGCISCHTVPGVTGAQGTVGPPLNDFGNRAYIAGTLPNTADNLIHWIQNPQQVIPGNDMPELGVTDSDARDIASYLYTLQDSKKGVLP